MSKPKSKKPVKHKPRVLTLRQWGAYFPGSTPGERGLETYESRKDALVRAVNGGKLVRVTARVEFVEEGE